MDAKNKHSRRQSSWRLKIDEIRGLAVVETLIVSSHSLTRLIENDWTLDDVLSALRSGQIVKAQPDAIAHDGKKYTISGYDCYGNILETVGKVILRDDGKAYFVITCY